MTSASSSKSNYEHDSSSQPKTTILLPAFNPNAFLQQSSVESLPPQASRAPTAMTANSYTKPNSEVVEWASTNPNVKPKTITDETVDSSATFPPEICGYLSKWTNYIHGWQLRYFVLREGVFSYFKSQDDTSSGCRGAIRIGRAEIRTYDFDNCRFDVAVNDTYWHLRAAHSDEKDRWLCAVETHRSILEQHQFAGQRRSPSVLSLQSVLSERSANTAAFHQHQQQTTTAAAADTVTASSSVARTLEERAVELLALRNLFVTQLDNVQARIQASSINRGASGSDHSSIFSATTDASGDSPPGFATKQSGSAGRESEALKNDFATFRLTAQSMVQAVTVCCELLAQHEQTTNTRLEREKQRRAKLKHAYQHVCDKLTAVNDQHAVLQRQCDELVKQRADSLTGLTRTYEDEPTMPITNMMVGSSSGTIRSTKQQPSGPLYGPDFQEGPHGRLNEEEFFDAIDAALDREEEVDAEESRQKAVYERLQSQKDVLQQIQEKVDASKTNEHAVSVRNTAHSEAASKSAETSLTTNAVSQPTKQIVPSSEELHIDPHLAHVPQEISEVIREQYDYALSPPDDGVWQLFVEEGDMRMYRREIEEGGLPIDPLKAQHIVHGVTAREIAYYFYAPETRMEWETTVDKVDVVVSLAENTKIFYQLHKRVWPTAQRESLFWSHMRKEDDLTRKFDSSGKYHLIDSWIVCNKSVELDDIQCGGGRVRVGLKICMVGQTYVPKEKSNVPLSALKRSDVHTRLAYCACVNPGGWVPAAGMRQVYKREYPRFLRKFTKYVSEKVKSKPLMWE